MVVAAVPDVLPDSTVRSGVARYSLSPTRPETTPLTAVGMVGGVFAMRTCLSVHLVVAEGGGEGLLDLGCRAGGGHEEPVRERHGADGEPVRAQPILGRGDFLLRRTVGGFPLGIR